MGLNPSPLYTPVPRNLPRIPGQTSRFMSPRDSASKLWKATAQAGDLAKRLANQNSAIVTQMNNQRRYGVSDGAHPFQIYQLPPIYRGATSSNDYLKVRCRQGGILMKPRVVPASGGSSATPSGLPTNNEGGGAWEPISNLQNFAPGPSITWANPLPGSGGGIPILGNFNTPFFGPPFTTEDEVYITNGGDPEYLMPAIGTGFFWLSCDDNGSGGFQPTIHFGGYAVNGGVFEYFGDHPPWIVISSGALFGYSIPPVPNQNTDYFIIGQIDTQTTGGNFQMYINQHIWWHWIDFPQNTLNWCGKYNTGFIYWTGDVVYDPGSGSGPSGLYMQMLGYNPIGIDGFDAGGIAAAGLPFGVSNYGPSDDGDNQAVWVPLGTGYTVA